MGLSGEKRAAAGGSYRARLQPLQNQLPQALTTNNPMLTLRLMRMRTCIAGRSVRISTVSFSGRGVNRAPITADNFAAAEEAVVHAAADAVCAYVHGQLPQRDHALNKQWAPAARQRPHMRTCCIVKP